MTPASFTRTLIGAVLCASALTCALPARAEGDEREAFARVVVAETQVRSGPSVSHRVIYVAHRGETFAIDGREGPGFWLRVLLPDGRVGYALGDTVEPIAIDTNAPDAPSKPGFFAPPALQAAHGGFALVAGFFEKGGYAELKPALVLAPQIALEPYAGVALSTEGRRFVYGGGGTLNFAPEWPVAPYVHLGGGAVSTVPNEDAQVLKGGTVGHARAGGGVLVSLRWRILIRVEAMHVVLFDSGFKHGVESYTAGLGTYF
ncbi:MAG TPA: SH3 domain-containing protein [Polyangiaceae bacterium]|nr:SH3 domain-containing protein [Polyangiaceae bacterium]